jgi:glycosyltransferase involved in cell wall biosynthesis
MIVSCIIPFFNPGRYFAPAIESVLGQDRPPDEVILVDDGSSDGSAERALAYGERVRLVRQDHKGIAAARNLGLRHARGDVIAFNDADDLWPDGRMSALAAELEAHADADIVIGRVSLLADRVPTREERAKFHDAHVLMLLASMLVRRRLFDRIGDFNEGLAVAEDTEFMMRARQGGAVVRLVETTSLLYRLHAGNVSRDITRTQASTLDALRSVLASRGRAQ